MLMLGLAEECSLIHPEHVSGGQNHPDGGPNAPGETHKRGPLQDQELAYEVAQRWKTDAREQRNHECSRKLWSEVGPTAEVFNVHRTSTLLHVTGEDEQSARRQPVSDHLVHGAVGPLLVEGKDAEHYKAEMAD